MTETEDPTTRTMQSQSASLTLGSDMQAGPVESGEEARDGKCLAEGTNPSTAVCSMQPEGILPAIQSVGRDLVALQQGFDAKIKYDASKERIIDALHQEVQEWRQDLHFKILRPVFMDLISMHDDLGNLLKHNDPDETVGTSERNLRRSLLTFQNTIEEILERNGVTGYSDPGQVFIPKRQRATKLIETADPGRDGLVAERVKKGFEADNRILRPEVVYTFKFNANLRGTESATHKEV